MGKRTAIQWAHSSANWQMGCDGCELWTPTKKKCYAGKQTRGMEGRKGWPVQFEQPALFLDRVPETLKWGPPTQLERDEKPWIPQDYPRVIFLNDMGDTFSKLLPANWMAPFLPMMGASPHQYLVLTKRPSELRKFAERFPLPPNVWPGTTITFAETESRVRELRQIRSGGPKWVSFEPVWSRIPRTAFQGIEWAIFGGESGLPEDRPEPCPVEWIEEGMDEAEAAGVRRFVKQLGSHPMKDGHRLIQKDSHGGDWREWPDNLQVREMPLLKLDKQQTLL